MSSTRSLSRLALVAAAVAASVGATGASPAAAAGSAATVNGESISVDDFEDALAEIGTAGLIQLGAEGELATGDDARLVLTELIVNEAIRQELVGAGVDPGTGDAAAGGVALVEDRNRYTGLLGEAGYFEVPDLGSEYNDASGQINGLLCFRLFTVSDEAPTESAPDDSATDDTATEESAPEGTATDDTASDDTVTEESAPEDTATEESAPEDTATDESAPEDSAPEDTATDDTATDDTASDDTATEESAPEDTATEDTAGSTAAEAMERLAAGEAFAEVAAEYDSTFIQSGGSVNGDPANPCVDPTTLTELAQPIVDALAEATVGEAVGPIETEIGTVIAVIPPFDEVSAQLGADGASAEAAAPAIAEIVSKADITVDARYGRWDATAGRVVALSAPAS